MMSCNENDYKSGIGQPMLTDQDESVYEAERLIRKRGKGNRVEYLVKWKGWSTRYNTWEPLENILDRRLIDQFEKEQNIRLKRPIPKPTIDSSTTTITNENRESISTEPTKDQIKSLNIRLQVRSTPTQSNGSVIRHYEPVPNDSHVSLTSKQPKVPSDDAIVGKKATMQSFESDRNAIDHRKIDIDYSTSTANESMDWETDRSNAPDDIYDEDNVFVNNYGRCLRRTPARTSAAAALVGSDEPHEENADIELTSNHPQQSQSDASQRSMPGPTSHSDVHTHHNHPNHRQSLPSPPPIRPPAILIHTPLQPRTHPQNPDVVSRTPSPVRWLPPPELWPSSRVELLDQIVVTDVISLDSKITVKECKTKHGFFKNFPPKQKRQAIRS